VARHNRHRRNLLRQWRELGAAQITIVHRPKTRRWPPNWTGWIFRALTASKIRNRNAGCSARLFARRTGPAGRMEIASWAIALGDQPHLRPETLRQVLDFMPRETPARSASRNLTGTRGIRLFCRDEAFKN
jgi:hypothetical protein